MINNVTKFKDCYGCGVCAITCPKELISIEYNEDGFYVPVINDIDKCNNCGLCLKVCSYNHENISEKNDVIGSYASWSNSDEVLNKCSSGGIAYELASQIIDDGYEVCGVRYSSAKEKVEHYIAKDFDELQDSVGSKYIQSYTLDAFKGLEKDRKYIVTGTPCQIDSLRRFLKLKKIEDNFLLVDFFCHGVPSKLMWDKYVSQIVSKFGSPDKISWRDKSLGWQNSWIMKAIYRNETGVYDCKYESPMCKGDLFYKFFLSDCCLSNACYDKCKYKMCSSSADLRVGDLWGSKYINNKKGVSGVISFTPKGDTIFRKLQDVSYVNESVEIVTESQMKKSPKRPISTKYVMYGLKNRMSLLSIYSCFIYPDRILKKYTRYAKKVLSLLR